MADANSELHEHNCRVIAWKDAQDFSGIRADKAAALRNTMLLVGFSANKESGVCTRTTRWLAASSAARGHGVRPVTRRRLQDHIATLEKLGLLSAARVKNGFTDKIRGLGAVNSYTCEFSQVAVRSDARSDAVSTVTKRTTEDQKIDSGFANGPEPEQKPEPEPTGRGRVSFDYPAYKPRAAAEKTPSIDARLTGSVAMDLIAAKFSDPVEREMCSEFVKTLRDYDCAQVVKAAGFFFTENSYVLRRGIDKPRAYAHKCAGSVRETLDGWKLQEESWRRSRESRAAEARLQAEHDKQQAEYDRRAGQEHAARGEVRITPLTADDWDAPGWLPRDQAAQVPGPSGELVWRPRKRRPDEIDWAAIAAGIDLGEDDARPVHTDSSAPGIGDLLDGHPAGYQEGDEGELGAGRR